MIKVEATKNAKCIAVDADDIVMTPNSSALRSIMLDPVVRWMAFTAYKTIKILNDSDKSNAIEKRAQRIFEVR